MTPEEREAEERRQRATLAEKIRRAREESGKEPFDFQKLSALFDEVTRAQGFRPLREADAAGYEQDYYLLWDVRTLRAAAEHLRWLMLHDGG